MRLTSLVTLATAAATAASANAATDVQLNGTDMIWASTPRQLQRQFRIYTMFGVDLVGKDITSDQRADVVACDRRCRLDPLPTGICTAVTWTPYQGGTCWYKGTEYMGTSSTPNAEANSMFMVKQAEAPLIWSATREGVDMPGNDLTTTRRKKMSECRDDCGANKDCYAVSWTSYNEGTCWLKRRASAYVAKAGALSAYVARDL